jgi:uncharacterized protein
MVKRNLFYVVNAVVVAALFALVGYYFGNFLLWLIGGVALGFGLAWGFDKLLYRLTRGNWWYRRRALMLTVIQIVLIVYVLAPIVYVMNNTRAANVTMCCVTPADLGADYRTVRIVVRDGVELAGWLIAPRDTDGATIIVAHGGGGNRLGSMWHAARLFEAGYGVLLYDQRALGESGGEFQSGGWLDTLDIPYIVDYLVGEAGVNPEKIGGVGLSLGGQIFVASAPDEPRLKALWVDGVGMQNVGDFPPAENLSEQLILSFNYPIPFFMALRLGFNHPSTIEQLEKLSDRPVMMIVGGRDDFEVKVNRFFMERAPDTIEFWTIPCAGHNGGWGCAPDEYAAKMVEFFDGVFQP